MNDMKSKFFLVVSILLAIGVALSIYFQSAAAISVVGLLVIAVLAVGGFMHRGENM